MMVKFFWLNAGWYWLSVNRQCSHWWQLMLAGSSDVLWICLPPITHGCNQLTNWSSRVWSPSLSTPVKSYPVLTEWITWYPNPWEARGGFRCVWFLWFRCWWGLSWCRCDNLHHSADSESLLRIIANQIAVCEFIRLAVTRTMSMCQSDCKSIRFLSFLVVWNHHHG